MTTNHALTRFAYYGLSTEADEREAAAYCNRADPDTIRDRLYRAVTASLRDEMKRAFVRRTIDNMPWEEASYWLSKSGTTRGRRAFKVLFGVSAERV